MKFFLQWHFQRLHLCFPHKSGSDTQRANSDPPERRCGISPEYERELQNHRDQISWQAFLVCQSEYRPEPPCGWIIESDSRWNEQAGKNSYQIEKTDHAVHVRAVSEGRSLRLVKN